MKLLDLTLPTPAENLALDEALLDAAEADPARDDVLRLWEPPSYFVVVGRSSRIAVEVNAAACREKQIPVLRRSSGGASVLAGPGCLMYGVVLSYRRFPELRMLDRVHAHVLSLVAAGLNRLNLGAEPRGTSDLAIAERKVSGNSLRCKRDHVLYHGTLLYNFDLPLVEQLLRTPPRQPEYRAGRSHGSFIANLPADAPHLRQAIAAEFGAQEPLVDWPRELTQQLVAERYGRDDWNLRH
ncbi:MAG: lipoate--protein ligase family protein [Pirellulaceae bacterium]